MSKKIIVTGGAGFIGSAVVRELINNTDHTVLNLDKLTYAGNLASLAPVDGNERYSFVQADICDKEKIDQILNEFQPDIIMHLAAESHVDRAIDGPSEFIQTNVVGTSVLLESARGYWESKGKTKDFIFHHISTDEVYGDLAHDGGFFTETTPYEPSSPYSASKASSDHLVRAWNRTFGLPTVVTNCSNNYGPYHFPEKLIPLTIINALHDKPLRVYGDGSQIRDWLFVEDHARALIKVATQGVVGETYNIGGHNEKTNLQVVEVICSLLQELKPQDKNYKDLIEFVTDRPGHDLRYAIDATKIEEELGWKPEETFESGIRKTVQWYLDNAKWWEDVMSGAYKGERMGGSK